MGGYIVHLNNKFFTILYRSKTLINYFQSYKKKNNSNRQENLFKHNKLDQLMSIELVSIIPITLNRSLSPYPSIVTYSSKSWV